MKNTYSTISEIQEGANNKFLVTLEEGTIYIKCTEDGMYYLCNLNNGVWKLKATFLNDEIIRG